MLKVVVDTNIWINGLLKRPPSRSFINIFLNDNFSLITSVDILNELSLTLRKPRLAPLLNESEIKDLLIFIEDHGRVVNPSTKLTVCRDSKDDKFLECSLESKADVLVTRDRDLLVLNTFEGTEILTPENFIKKFHIK